MFLVTQMEGFYHVTFYNKNLNLLLKGCATIFFSSFMMFVQQNDVQMKTGIRLNILIFINLRMTVFWIYGAKMAFFSLME